MWQNCQGVVTQHPNCALRIMSKILRSRQQSKFDKFHNLRSARHGPRVQNHNLYWTVFVDIKIFEVSATNKLLNNFVLNSKENKIF
jgi:hypothetical protein